MITLQVPTFDEFDNYAFKGYVDVKIKNKPNWEDVNKITKHLPGIPQGGIGKTPLHDLLTDKKKAVGSFYDIRQLRGKRKTQLWGYFVYIKN